MAEGIVSEGSFVELDYTGRVKDSGHVFDTTKREVAEADGINEPTVHYGPVIVCVGQGQLLKGIEKGILGKAPGFYRLDISPDDGFGRKNAKLFQLISASKFKEQKIMPMPGLQVNVDGMFGIIKTVSGGRTVVDFNHPLAGKDLDYEVEVKRIVLDTKEKLDSMMKFFFKEFKADVNEGKAVVELKPAFPEPLKEKLSADIRKLIPEITDVEFTAEKL